MNYGCIGTETVVHLFSNQKMHEVSESEFKAFIFLLFFVDDVRPSVVDTRDVSFSALDEGGG